MAQRPSSSTRKHRKDKPRRDPRRERKRENRRAGNSLAERPIREDLVRAAALECLGAILQERHLADRVLERVLRREQRLYSNERRAVAERVYSVLRRKATLDFAIQRGLGDASKSLTSVERDTIRLAGARLLEGEPRERLEQGAGLRQSEKRVLDIVANLPKELEGLPDVQRVAVQGSVPPFLAELLL